MRNTKIFIICFILGTLAAGFVLQDVWRQHRKYAREHLYLNNIKLAWPSSGQAAFACVDRGVTARSSHQEDLRPIASVAKIITALAIMKKQPFDGQKGETYTVSDSDVQRYKAYKAERCSVLPLRKGMKLTQYQAMQRMLIASDNNMADLLTERIFGSRKAYLEYARNMLRSMQLERTLVVDATGLSPATVSTPSELVVLGTAALRNKIIAEIVGQKQATLPGIGVIRNTNQLLGTNGVIGIKTGTTGRAGSCLLFASSFRNGEGEQVVIVAAVMGSKDHRTLYRDSRSLISSAKKAIVLPGWQRRSFSQQKDAAHNYSTSNPQK